MQGPVHGEYDGLTRLDIPHKLKVKSVQGHALGGHHQFRTGFGIAHAEHHRPYAVRITKGHDTVTRYHRDRGVTAAATAMHALDRVKYIVLVEAEASSLHLELVREYVQQDFRIRLGIDVAPVLGEQLTLQFLRVGQIAVVRQGDTVGRIDVKGLRLSRRRTACGRIPDVAYAHGAAQFDHVLHIEHVARQTIVLAQMQFTALASHDPGRILTAMLQHQQGVIQRLIDRPPADYAYNSAHIK